MTIIQFIANETSLMQQSKQQLNIDTVNVMMPQLAPHILDWIYSEGFGEVTIPDKALEAKLKSVAMLESASENDSTFKNNERVVIGR